MDVKRERLTIVAAGLVIGVIAAGLTAFYACTDEFHQLFVPGRAGLLSDVLIDSLSAVLGLVVFALLQKFVVWFCRRKERK